MPNDLHPVPTDPSSLAAAGFLARYREPTVSAYRNDLRCYWSWCAQPDLQPLQAQRAHLELYDRDLHAKGYAPATMSRRLSTVAGLFRYAVIDEVVVKNPHPCGDPTQGAVGGTAEHGAASGSGSSRRSTESLRTGDPQSGGTCATTQLAR